MTKTAAEIVLDKLPYKLGSWKPELPDHRDRPFKAPRAIVLPPEVKPMGIKGRIHNQGTLSSCTGHAATTALEIVLGLDGDAQQLSRLMAYHTGREYIGQTHLDEGAFNRDVIKGLTKVGACEETVWKYAAKNLFAKPSASAYKRAAKMQEKVTAAGVVYERINGLDGVLAALAGGAPVVFGFTCFAPLFALTAKDCVLPMPQPTDQPLGGHAVVTDGYSIPEKFIWVQNSWGTKFGVRGYFKMPFTWLTDRRRLVDDLWAVRRTIAA